MSGTRAAQRAAWSRRHLLLLGGAAGAGALATVAACGGAPSRPTAAGPSGAPSTTGAGGPGASAAAVPSGAVGSPLPAAGPLLWSAEFDGAAGTGLDPAVWRVRTGAGGWGNGELQCYRDDADSVSLDGAGSLRLTMRRRDVVDAAGSAARFTSGRVETVQTFTAARIQARARVPLGTGLWSAFWTTGADIDAVGWPRCGELDVLEHYDDARAVEQVAHGAQLDAGGATREGRGWSEKAEVAVADPTAFHVYGVDLAPDALRFSVDGVVTSVVVRDGLADDEHWPFDQPQRITLNLAMSRWLGEELPDLPASLEVDWVRVHGPAAVVAGA